MKKTVKVKQTHTKLNARMPDLMVIFSSVVSAILLFNIVQS